MKLKENAKLKDEMSFGVSKELKDGIHLESNMRIELVGQDGIVKEVQEIHNDIYQGAQYGLVDQIADTPTISKVGWMAVGTGVIAAAPGTFATTKLTAEVARVAMTTKTRTNNSVDMVASFGAGVGTGILTEIGTFDVVTANTVHIWNGATMNFTKGANDTLNVTWTLTVS